MTSEHQSPPVQSDHALSGSIFCHLGQETVQNLITDCSMTWDLITKSFMIFYTNGSLVNYNRSAESHDNRSSVSGNGRHSKLNTNRAHFACFLHHIKCFHLDKAFCTKQAKLPMFLLYFNA